MEINGPYASPSENEHGSIQLAKAEGNGGPGDGSKPKNTMNLKGKEGIVSDARKAPRRVKKAPKVRLGLLPTTHKLVVRNLPPLLTCDAFLDQVFKLDSCDRAALLSHYYVQGEYPENPYLPFVHSRCYLQCVDESALMAFGKAIKEMKFTDNTVQESARVFSPSVEKALFGSMPNEAKVGPSNGKITDDQFYTHFVDYCQGTGLFAPGEGKEKTKCGPGEDPFQFVESVVANAAKIAKAQKSAERNVHESAQQKAKEKTAAKRKNKAKAKQKQVTEPAMTGKEKKKPKAQNLEQSKLQTSQTDKPHAKPQKKPSSKSKHGNQLKPHSKEPKSDHNQQNTAHTVEETSKKVKKTRRPKKKGQEQSPSPANPQPVPSAQI